MAGGPATESTAPSRGMGRPRVIAIDGPAGTGKSFTAKELAARLSLLYLDSGALYRTIALAAERDGRDPDETQQWNAWLAELAIVIDPQGGAFRVWLGTEEVTQDIRREEVGLLASRLAIVPAVRDRVGLLLGELAARYDCVAEGRDMGTTVFPDADLKIFLTASEEARTQRRMRQLACRGLPADAVRVGRELGERDARDSRREASPLRMAPGAVRIDNTQLTEEEQVALIVDIYRGGGWRPGTIFFRAVKGFAGLLLKHGVGVRVRGREHIPPGPCLLASNHRSYLDPPIVGTFHPGASAFMAKEELFRVPLLGPLIRALNALPVRRGRADRGALRRALAALERLLPLVIFPEGTRSRDGRLGRAHMGVAFLARKADVPVVPVRIWGGSTWRSMLRREPMQLAYGPPLRYAHDAPGGDRAFAAQLMQAIAELG